MLTVDEFDNRNLDDIHVSVEENIGGKIITGLGAGREGSGTTRTLYHLAERLASTSHRVCIVDYNLPEPCLDKFFEQNPKVMNLDALYKRITDRITKGMISESILVHRKYRNLFLLPGTRRSYSVELFQADALVAILKGLQHLFDIVLVDVSAHFDNPGTVSGLLAADEVLVFSNYDEDGIRLFNIFYEAMLKHHEHVKNKMKVVGVETFKGRIEELKFLIKLPIIANVAHMPDFHKSFQDYDLKGKKFEKYLQSIDKIIQYLNLELIAEGGRSPQRKGGFKLWPIRQS